jgi:hypothetical protein
MSGICCGQALEEAIKGLPVIKKAGFESVKDLSRTDVGFASKACKNLAPRLRLLTTSNSEQRF